MRYTVAERDAITFHLSFAFIAAVTLLTTNLEPGIEMGRRIWILILGYYAGILYLVKHNNNEWIQMFKLLIPLGVIMVVPDGYFVIGLKTLEFTDMGVGQIFGVSSFMCFMWTIPLFISTAIGRGIERRGASIWNAALSAGFVSILIFTAAEHLLAYIPIWYFKHCTMIGYHPLYVLLPEYIAGAMTYLACRVCIYEKNISYPAVMMGAFIIMSTYVGSAVVCYMLIDYDKLIL